MASLIDGLEREVDKQTLRSFFGLFTGNQKREHWMSLGKVVGIGLLFAFPFVLVCAIVQVFFLGFSIAAKAYCLYWIVGLVSVPLFIGLIILIITLLLCFQLYIIHLQIRFPAKANQIKAIWKWLDEWAAPAIFIPLILVICFFAAIKASVKYKEKIGLENPSDLPSIAQVASNQKEAVSSLSSSAKTMLLDLSATESELAAARDKLEKTLAALNEQEKAAEDASAHIKEISEKKELLEQRLKMAETFVGNQKIATLNDINSSGNEGLVWGFLLGIPAGIISTLIYDFFQKKFFK